MPGPSRWLTAGTCMQRQEQRGGDGTSMEASFMAGAQNEAVQDFVAGDAVELLVHKLFALRDWGTWGGRRRRRRHQRVPARRRERAGVPPRRERHTPLP